MKKGTIKFFNDSKGFGFIKEEGTGEEVFVHVTGLGGLKVREGDSVTYDVQDGKKGLNAINVRIA